MPVPTSISDLSEVQASNYPTSSDLISSTDDYLRAHASILKRLANGTDALNTPALGTPASGTLTNCTGLPPSTGLSAAVGVSKGGTGLTTVAALSALVADSLDTPKALTATANQSIRVNAGGTAWEAYTPSTGTGDVTGQSSSVDNEIALFSGTGGKTIKRATTTGILKATSGVISAATAGTDYGYINVPQSGSAKTTSYSLATTDIGEFIEVGSGGSITIPDATFAAGDVVSIFNNTSAGITITCTITTAYIAGTDSDKATVTLATRGLATILFLSGTVCVISGNVS